MAPVTVADSGSLDKVLDLGNTGGRIASPPVAFSVNGRQFIAIGSGEGSIADGQVSTYWPETRGREPQSAATLFVFALPERSR